MLPELCIGEAVKEQATNSTMLLPCWDVEVVVAILLHLRIHSLTFFLSSRSLANSSPKFVKVNGILVEQVDRSEICPTAKPTLLSSRDLKAADISTQRWHLWVPSMEDQAQRTSAIWLSFCVCGLVSIAAAQTLRPVLGQLAFKHRHGGCSFLPQAAALQDSCHPSTTWPFPRLSQELWLWCANQPSRLILSSFGISQNFCLHVLDKGCKSMKHVNVLGYIARFITFSTQLCLPRP
mmetsp:Transcript_52526/g.122924  ORF Transcript_52526/g.122924 Transcript_52526/m.122924 type:complete len:236 (-) Transcript_52526:314-1021(-)